MNTKSIIPPMVAIRLGNEIFIKGPVTGGVTTTYSGPLLYNKKYAVINIQLTVSEADPYDALDAVADGSFRGITQTFKDGIFKSTVSAPTIKNDPPAPKTQPKQTPVVKDTVKEVEIPKSVGPSVMTGVDGPAPKKSAQTNSTGWGNH